MIYLKLYLFIWWVVISYILCKCIDNIFPVNNWFVNTFHDINKSIKVSTYHICKFPDIIIYCYCIRNMNNSHICRISSLNAINAVLNYYCLWRIYAYCLSSTKKYIRFWLSTFDFISIYNRIKIIPHSYFMKCFLSTFTPCWCSNCTL